MLTPEKLVLFGQFGGGLLDLALELGGRFLQLFVQPCLLECLRQVVQDRDNPDQLSLLGEDLAGKAFDRRGAP